ncbi:MAG TPA: aryl-sulfate sulfotransferase [Rhizobiales bacterium]|nr:aryl-sulfate sulfotransferase [Hyphomicrobiales bacterium]
MPRQIKRSVTIKGHKTSISLEAPFWDALKDIAAHQGLSINALTEEIDKSPRSGGLSSAIRIYILNHYRNAPPE